MLIKNMLKLVNKDHQNCSAGPTQLMKNLDFPKIARQAVWDAIADSVKHLYVILLSEVSRIEIADAMKNLQQSEKALERATDVLWWWSIRSSNRFVVVILA